MAEDDFTQYGYDDALKARVEELKTKLENPEIPSDDVTKFEKHGILGSGRFCRVFKVYCPSQETFYAMKEMPKKQIAKKNVILRIKQERDILVGTNNFPFVIKLICCCKDTDSLYFITELAAGGDLSRFTDDHSLDEQNIRFYVAQVLMALEYLHGATIMHRDIKLQNILVCSDGYVKVTDYNLSRFLMIGLAFTICGTRGYMAPEIQDGKGYTFTVDWFALGAVADEMTNRYLEKRSRELGATQEATLETQQFIKAMSEKDPKKRLGAKGALEVRRHPFFSTINWDTLYVKLVEAPIERPRAAPLKEDDGADSNVREEGEEAAPGAAGAAAAAAAPPPDFDSFC